MENVLRFEHPEYLYGLLIIPLLIIIYILFRMAQKKRFERFASLAMRNYLVPTHSNRRANFKFVVFLLALSSMILALANLQSGSKMEEVKREGIDLYLAIDVSNSMNAEDIVPSRMERSKQAINKLISELRGDRIGSIGRTGKATGPHLHYEVLYKGNAINPYSYMNLDMSVEEYIAMITRRREESGPKTKSTLELLKGHGR